MNKLDNILDAFRFTKDNEIRQLFVQGYWNAGAHTFQPCYEILTDYAIVKDILVCEEDLDAFKKDMDYCGNLVERTNLFTYLIQRINLSKE